MSFLFVHSAVDEARLSPSEFRLLAHLARRAGTDGRISSSVENMGKVCGMAPCTIKICLRELTRRNIIFVSEARLGQTPIRRLNPPSDWIPPVGKTTQVEIQPGLESKPGPSRKTTPPPGWENLPQSRSSEVYPKKVIQLLSGFDAFWKAYPRKKAKGTAMMAWGKLRLNDSLNDILTALEWQTRSDQWRKDRGQYVPYPSTYLNSSGWLDEPDIQSKPLQPLRNSWDRHVAEVIEILTINDGIEGPQLPKLVREIRAKKTDCYVGGEVAEEKLRKALSPWGIKIVQQAWEEPE